MRMREGKRKTRPERSEKRMQGREIRLFWGCEYLWYSLASYARIRMKKKTSWEIVERGRKLLAHGRGD